ncbi:UNVERIFIED_CONTAM: hypothetical protein PYX00_002804 [Menopon gallinae]|uniref:Ig-like domain-containing protein n=1 Tax=Menopon gallinae TaxID=328185 RepID=A0AAW2HY44_9NEOP
MVAREGSNVTMRCAAKGTPEPKIIWKREGGETIPLGHGQEVASVEGSVFNISRVSRLHMGAYLCIAYNGIPPSVSKRITLIVHFPPMIWIQNQLIGAHEGQQVTLECHSEAYPKSINYWTRDRGDIIAQGNKYEPQLLDNAYKVHMKLTIKSVSLSDYGTYKCVSKNSLGDTDGSIKLYQVTKEMSYRTRDKGTFARPGKFYGSCRHSESGPRRKSFPPLSPSEMLDELFSWFRAVFFKRDRSLDNCK